MRNCTPATSNVVVMEEAQPEGVPLTIASITTIKAAIRPATPMAMPAKMARRSGRTEKLVARLLQSEISRLIV